MTLHKKLLTYHLRRLQDKDRAVRLKTIQELIELNDVEALEALKHTYENDPDQEVQKAAREAGRRIFVSNQEPQS